MIDRDQGVKVTVQEKDKAMAEIEVYKRWFFQHILPLTPDGRSDAILMLPCGSGKPKYRDLPNA